MIGGPCDGAYIHVADPPIKHLIVPVTVEPPEKMRSTLREPFQARALYVLATLMPGEVHIYKFSNIHA
jgi:hypothetical protein